MQRIPQKLGWLVVLLALLTSPTAAADDDVADAAETFAAAEKAYRRGDFSEAAAGFEASHELAPHGAALYNAAMAWLAAEERGRAADAFARARKVGGLNDKQDRVSLERLDELRGELGRVAVGAPRGSSIWLKHAEGVAAPALVHLEPGDYEVRVRLPSGEESRRDLAVAAGELLTLSFTSPAESPESPEPGEEPDGEAGGESALAIGAWVAVGTAVAAAGAAMGTGMAALDARDEFDASGYVDRDAYDQADSLRTAANVCWAIAGVSATAGVVLFVLAYSDTDDTDSDPRTAKTELRMGPGGVWLSGTW